MKIKQIKLIVLFLLFLIALYFWTLPIQKNQYPYGDVDSSTHFALSDDAGQGNVPVYYLPYYLNFSYGSHSGGKLWYAPQYHLDGAILQIFGGRDQYLRTIEELEHEIYAVA